MAYTLIIIFWYDEHSRIRNQLFPTSFHHYAATVVLDAWLYQKPFSTKTSYCASFRIDISHCFYHLQLNQVIQLYKLKLVGVHSLQLKPVNLHSLHLKPVSVHHLQSKSVNLHSLQLKSVSVHHLQLKSVNMQSTIETSQCSPFTNEISQRLPFTTETIWCAQSTIVINRQIMKMLLFLTNELFLNIH